jgi:hypothetical protein
LPPLRLDLLLEPGDADLEEFIQVGMGDPEELHPLEQWNRGIQRLVQDPLVELEPREFAIEKTSRNPPGRRIGDDLRSFWGIASERALLTGHDSSETLD